ncbi:MAG: hypothetical protein GX493_03865, partial [Firmicutes bacterium]|nr:hypothetical protein [Bacillota bacterium]
MKKVLTLVLACVFVFTLAAVASADFSISGQFIAKYHTLNESPYFDTSKWRFETASDSSDTSRIELLVKGTYGNVTADFKERFRLADNANTTGDLKVEGRTANIFYNFSNQLSAGLTWDKSGDTAYQVYQSPIIPDLQWEYIDLAGTELYAVVKINTGDLAATVISPMIEYNSTAGKSVLGSVMGGFTYNLDPMFIAGAAKAVYDASNDNYYYVLQPSVMYALTDEIQVGGEVYYNSNDTAFVKNAVGVGGLYKSKDVMVNGGVYYDLDAEDIGAYALEAEYTGVANFKFYAYYYYNNLMYTEGTKEYGFLKYIDDDETKFYVSTPGNSNKDSIEAGVTYYLDPKKMAWIDVAYCKLDRQWYEIEFGV